MQSEDRLREKLRKIEVLYAGATTAREKFAAGATSEFVEVGDLSSRQIEPDWAIPGLFSNHGGGQ